VTSRLAFLIVAAVVPGWAHHWFAAQYDSQKTVTLTGTVARMEWTNPHTHFSMEVKDGSPNAGLWEFEMGSPSGMRNLGWSRTTLNPGDVITVTAYMAKDGGHLGNARTITFSDGRKILARAPDDASPSQ
jgi:hypothetical protein